MHFILVNVRLSVFQKIGSGLNYHKMDQNFKKYIYDKF